MATYFNLFKPAPGQLIPIEWIHGVVDAVDFLYTDQQDLRSLVTMIYQLLNEVIRKLDIVYHYLFGEITLEILGRIVRLEARELELPFTVLEPVMYVRVEE